MDERYAKMVVYALVRPGWGRVGSQPTDEYLFFSKYTGTDSYNGANSIYPSNIG